MAYKKVSKSEEKEAYENRFKDWMEELKKFQSSDLDQREQARESDRFLLDKDGQWEEAIARQLDSQQRPRYTFDKITPAIEAMMADIEDMDFGCNVKPEGGEANKDVADTYEGMIRGIQNMSKTEGMYRKSARRLIRRGFDAWIVKARHKDEWSFDQDLFVESIPNAINRVWTANTCVKEDSSDSDVAYVLSSLSPEDYAEQYPEGSKVSVDDGDIDYRWDEYRPEVITIGERYYQKSTPIKIAQLTNGDVIELNEDWEKIKDEKADEGIFIAKANGVERIKTVKGFKWYHCVFDGGGILSEERETVFKTCPVVTVYGNHELLGQNSKITYSGITLKEMDAQRVHNYAKSREVEEGALSPRKKIIMTKKQAKGHEKQIARMNISADPVQFINADPEAPNGIQETGGSQVNPHLSNLGNQMAMDINQQANVTDSMMGQFAASDSEKAVRMKIDRGTAATRKWVNALVNGIQRVCDILIQSIPAVYDTKRQFALVGIDGTEEMVTLNNETFDKETQTMVMMNVLNAGKYKVTASAGPAFTNRLEAGLNAMIEYAAIDPSIIQTGGDLMLKAIDAPLVDQMAERKRAQLLQSGVIPVGQMTDDEKEMMEQQAQQPKEPDAMTIAAQAEQLKAEAAMLKAENDKTSLMIDGAKLEQAGQKLSVEEAKAVSDIRNKDADTLKKVAETQKIGVEANTAEMEALITNMPTEEIVRMLSE